MRLVLGIAAALALAVAGVAAAALLYDDDTSVDVAGIRIAGDEHTVRGVGYFEQNGDRLTGFVAVWGLKPDTTHAVHFHGPDSRCGSQADPVAVHPDLRTDADGVAHADVAITVNRALLDGGYYYNVHEGPTTQAENPEIACGDITP